MPGPADEPTPTGCRPPATPESGERRAAGDGRARRSSRRWWLAAVAVVVLVHVAALSRVPPGLYADEASFGYNAFCVLRTGADEAGERLPLFFRAFGEYKSPVFAYALVPAIALLGPTPAAVRLVAALFALGTAAFLGLLVGERSGSRTLGRLAFVLAGLLPWLFTPGRVGWESPALPCLISAAWWAWERATRARSLAWFALSWLAWTLAFYSYPPARLMVPVLVVLLVSTSRRELAGSRLRCALAGSVLLAGLVVVGMWSFAHPGALTGRLRVIAGWRDSSGLAGAVGGAIVKFLRYLSPQFLFTHGDPILRHHSGWGGELFLFMLPALVVGLVVAWTRSREGFFGFALLGFAAFPLAACLTEGDFHAMRTNCGAPFALVLVMVGVERVAPFLRSHRPVLLGAAFFACLEAGMFLGDYFAAYPRRAGAWFNAGLPDAVRAALAAKRGPLRFAPEAFLDENGWVNQPYIYFAFLGRLDPRTFQRAGLDGFDIRPLRPGEAVAPGTVVLLKTGEEYRTTSGKPVVVPDRNVPSGDFSLLAEIPAGGERFAGAPAYRVMLAR